MRVIVTGSRHLYPIDHAHRIVCRLVVDAWPEGLVIVHGCCPVRRSVDWAFDMAAELCQVPREQFRPHDYGSWPGCGPTRNSAMVAAGADMGIAYHDNLAGSRGTMDCVRKMLAADIPVTLYKGKDDRGRRIERIAGKNTIIMGNPPMMRRVQS